VNNIKVGDVFEFAFYRISALRHDTPVQCIVLKVNIKLPMVFIFRHLSCKLCPSCKSIVGAVRYEESDIYHQILVGNKKLIIGRADTLFGFSCLEGIGLQQ